MTITSYNKLKKALIEQRLKVTASRQAASQFIDDLDLRDIVFTPSKNPKKKTAYKASSKKTANK